MDRWQRVTSPISAQIWEFQVAIELNSKSSSDKQWHRQEVHSMTKGFT
jgi:hypothetical protein